MEITPAPSTPRESRTPLWIVIAAATVAIAAALAGHAFSSPANHSAPPSALAVPLGG